MRKDGLEDLSAFLDGELPHGSAERLIDALEGDEELKAAWARYHLIADVLARRLPAGADRAFSERVSGAIAAEPVPLRSARRRVPRVKSVVGLAMAAAVAGLAIAGILSTGSKAPSEPPPLSFSVSQQSPPMSSMELSPLPIATVKWSGEPYGEAGRFSPYIVSHNQSNRGLPIPGVIPYVRAVGYEAEP